MQDSTALLRKRILTIILDMVFLIFCTHFILKSFVATSSITLLGLSAEKQFALVKNLHKLKMPVFYIISFSYYFYSFYIGHGKTLGGLLNNISVIPKNFSDKNDISHHLSFRQSLLRATANITIIATFMSTIFFPLFIILCIIPIFRYDNRGISAFVSSSSIITEEDKNKIYLQRSINKNILPEPQSNVIHLPFNKEDKDEAA